MAVILPPKVYHYEPKIYGFKIAGKRGSAYFNPPKGNVKIVEDSLQVLELEKLKKENAEKADKALHGKELKVSQSLPQDFDRQLKLESIEDS